MPRSSSVLVALASLPLVAAPAAADVVRLVDGKVLEDVRIEGEGLKTISYTAGDETKTVPSAEVLDVDYGELPDALAQAELAVAEGDLEGAVGILEQYVQHNVPRVRVPERWAPPYAAWRVVGLLRELGDGPAAAEAAGRLIASFPASRYVPHAYVLKADEEFRAGRKQDAATTIGDLESLVRSEPLSKRWDLEVQISRVEMDARSSGEKRDSFEALAAEAGTEHPTVRARALVAAAETYLDEAQASRGDLTLAQDLRDRASELLRRVVESPGADDGALAGAHAGLGECLYYEGAPTADEELLREGALHCLRVAVLYRDQPPYVPKALYFAMRCFDLLKERGKKLEMQRELEARYPSSRWAEEAKRYGN